ncbi:DivIVA domain-containing protein [Glycomyces paridis]|uniref:Cell wall synthesis protein Wag31 n=1 Tax=Glycomyces paridis TaxID=2126555 RepID=A0A4S8NVU0_9ACTN|nr:DivIVA domain-containing protein [Glycomyces paridis]THV21740.1 DivIVA domain-containing protein [Glycomyces paridis]
MYTYRQSGGKVTVGQVNNARFSMTSLTRRGYQPDEVHRFLTRIADELASRDQREAALRADAEKLKEALRSWQSQQSSQRLQAASPTTPTSTAVNLISQAQQQAEGYVNQAQHYSRQIIAQARAQASELMRQTQERAKAEADRAVADFRRVNDGHSDREAEERIRQLVRTRSYLDAVEVAEEQLRLTRAGLEKEIAKLQDEV